MTFIVLDIKLNKTVRLLESAAFVKKSFEKEQLPNIEYIYAPSNGKIFSLTNSCKLMNVFPKVLNSDSRGTITLNATVTTWGAPIIRHRFSQQDRERFSEEVRIFFSLFKTKVFQKNKMTLIETSQSLCKQFEFSCDNYWYNN